jgi:hypothetical protein
MNKVRWVFMPQFINVGTNLQAQQIWTCLKDDPPSSGYTLGNN